MLNTDSLKTALRNIDPLTSDIIDAMATAFENWLKSATITVPSLSVTVDPKTGVGETKPATLNGAVS